MRLGWLGYCSLHNRFVVALTIDTQHGGDDSYSTWGNTHRNGGLCSTGELRRCYFTQIRNTDVPRLQRRKIVRYSEICAILKFVVLKYFYIDNIGNLAGILKMFVNVKNSLTWGSW